MGCHPTILHARSAITVLSVLSFLGGGYENFSPFFCALWREVVIYFSLNKFHEINIGVNKFSILLLIKKSLMENGI